MVGTSAIDSIPCLVGVKVFPRQSNISHGKRAMEVDYWSTVTFPWPSSMAEWQTLRIPKAKGYCWKLFLDKEVTMGISGSYNGGTVPYKAIFCWDIPLHSPYIGLIYGTSNLGSWNGQWYLQATCFHLWLSFTYINTDLRGKLTIVANFWTTRVGPESNIIIHFPLIQLNPQCPNSNSHVH